MVLSMVKLKNTTYSFIAQNLRYIEWTVLASTFLIRLLYFFRFLHEFNSIMLLHLCLEVFLLTAYVFLSFLFPIARPTWQIRAYILLEILLALSLHTMHISYDFLLYIVYAKVCFLLNHKDVKITLITTGIAWGLIRIWQMHSLLNDELYKTEKIAAEAREPMGFILDNIIYQLFIYLAITIFVISFSYLVVAERKSRRRAEALAQEVETLAATLERTRIAREIHDSLGHTLTTLNVQLELAQALYERDCGQTRQSLDKAKQLASQCLKDVRQALQTLRQQNFNLNQDLSNLVAQFKQVSSANSQSVAIYSTINLPPLPLPMSHQIYQIVKEALTNIQKHAEASRVIVKASVSADRITLELGDDGKGFNPQTPHSGFGLRGMQERVELLGGQLQIHTTPNRGTLIQVAIPYDSTASS
jgi:signal transduction histidine kinase